MASRNDELFQRAQLRIPAGVNSPVRAFRAVGGTPPFLERASGAHLWDAEGKRYIGQGLAQNLLDVQEGARNGDRTQEVLTTAERNILKLVAEGKSNPEVAAAIGLTPRTVETYRLRLMRKLGIENLPSLVRYAIRHGIIALE